MAQRTSEESREAAIDEDEKRVWNAINQSLRFSTGATKDVTNIDDLRSLLEAEAKADAILLEAEAKADAIVNTISQELNKLHSLAVSPDKLSKRDFHQIVLTHSPATLEYLREDLKSMLSEALNLEEIGAENVSELN